jgi:hypothetical protein
MPGERVRERVGSANEPAAVAHSSHDGLSEDPAWHIAPYHPPVDVGTSFACAAVRRVVGGLH